MIQAQLETAIFMSFLAMLVVVPILAIVAGLARNGRWFLYSWLVGFVLLVLTLSLGFWPGRSWGSLERVPGMLALTFFGSTLVAIVLYGAITTFRDWRARKTGHDPDQ